MGTDFFDEDLTEAGGQRGLPLDSRREMSLRKRDEKQQEEEGRLVQQREQRTHRVAGAVEEIERLRTRQLELEREKTDLEQLSRKQDDYEQTKRDIVTRLEKSIVLLDKQAVEAARVGDLVATIRGRFQETLKDIREIREEDWPPDRFELELSKAMVRVDEAQSVYRKGLSKVKATNWFRDAGDEATGAAEPAAARPASRGGAGYWIMAGFAFSFPLIAAIVVCFVVWLYLTGIL